MFQFDKLYTEWTLERISRHILYWSAWLIFYASVNSSFPPYTFWDWVQVELVIMLVKLPLTYFIIYDLVPRYLIKKKYGIFFLKALMCAIIGGFAIFYLYQFIINPYIFQPEHAKGLKKIFYFVLDLVYIVSLPTAFKLLQLQFQQEKMTLSIAEQKLDAELKLLKNQLHPHFLFNTLNNLYGMVLTQHPDAADVVIRLSNMMSYMLYECEGPITSLEKELDNLNNYIELEKIRYGRRLEISFETAGDVSDHHIAPLLLIPFVENAFKHGVEKTERPSWIRLNLWIEGAYLHFLIENSIPEEKELDQLPKTQSGIGLVNVRKRLQLLYPEKHHLEIKQGDSFLVQLKIEL